MSRCEKLNGRNGGFLGNLEFLYDILSAFLRPRSHYVAALFFVKNYFFSRVFCTPLPMVCDKSYKKAKTGIVHMDLFHILPVDVNLFTREFYFGVAVFSCFYTIFSRSLLNYKIIFYKKKG